jgi:Fanconi anemia group M protein
MNEIKNNKTEEKKIVIYIDHRERNSLIVKKLVEFGVNIGLKNLEVGDYLLGGDVAVEYKTCTDFVDSIIDGRILKQAKELKKYKKPVFIIEGEEDIFSLRKIHPNAIRGMLATISVSYGIPILQTRTPYETASLMHIIAKRMQEDEDREFVYHTLKPQTLKEQQEYIVSALPNIGTKLARPLLKKFKTVKKIINASEEQLQKIDLIGPKKAKGIKDVIDKEYKED